MSHTLTTPNVHADRAAEYHQLITKQGSLARSRRTFPDGDYSKYTAEEHERCRRLEDLAELINSNLEPDSPVRRDVAADVERWIENNPTQLTNQIVEGKLAAARKAQSQRNPDVGVVGQVFVDVGAVPGGNGYSYTVMVEDFSTNSYGQLRFKVPESVAEHFRNQGRSQKQREMRAALGL